MSKKPIYTKPPATVRYKGHQFVLAAEEGEEEPVLEETPVEEEPPKKKSTGAARVNINECSGTGVTFIIKALVHSYDGVDVPGLGDAGSAVRRRHFKVRQINKLTSIPKDVLRMIEDDSAGEAVMGRIEKLLKVRPSPPLYLIEAKGGWNWNKRNGEKNVAEIQRLLEYVRGRRAILFSYCHNKTNHEGEPTLL